MENKLSTSNEFYRGYTLVRMVDKPNEVRIMDVSGEYIQFPDVTPSTPISFSDFNGAKTWLDAQIRYGVMQAVDFPRTKAVVGDNGLQFVVSTPGGDIVAKSLGGPDYPDISICINGHCVAFVEWNYDSKQFNLQYYGSSDDEPKATFKNITQ